MQKPGRVATPPHREPLASRQRGDREYVTTSPISAIDAAVVLQLRGKARERLRLQHVDVRVAQGPARAGHGDVTM